MGLIFLQNYSKMRWAKTDQIDELSSVMCLSDSRVQTLAYGAMVDIKMRDRRMWVGSGTGLGVTIPWGDLYIVLWVILPIILLTLSRVICLLYHHISH